MSWVIETFPANLLCLERPASFLDYFGLKKLDDLPPLADIKDGYPELSPQSGFLDALEEAERTRTELRAQEEPTFETEEEDATEAVSLHLVSEQSSS